MAKSISTHNDSSTSPHSEMNNKERQEDPQLSGAIKEDLRRLELKVAYNERLNQELSSQVYELHREVALLTRALKTLKVHLERGDESTLQIGPADEPPPHY